MPRPQNERVARMAWLKRFIVAESGATSVEYALVALFVALAIIVGATALGLNLEAAYANVAGKFPPLPGG